MIVLRQNILTELHQFITEKQHLFQQINIHTEAIQLLDKYIK